MGQQAEVESCSKAQAGADGPKLELRGQQAEVESCSKAQAGADGSVKSVSVNDEDNSASQDFSTPPAYVYSPESKEPAATSSNNPEAASLIVEGSGHGGSPVSPPAPPEPLVESGSSP
ncbi:unnamed protein product [Leuciscus chuanchicus]